MICTQVTAERVSLERQVAGEGEGFKVAYCHMIRGLLLWNGEFTAINVIKLTRV